MRSALLLLALFSHQAGAETLVGRALICEEAKPLELVRSDINLQGKSGDRIMEVAKSTVKFAGVWGQTATYRVQKADADAMAAPYAELLRLCALTDGQPAPISIVERKPISKTARIKLTVGATPVEVWTPDYMIQP